MIISLFISGAFTLFMAFVGWVWYWLFGAPGCAVLSAGFTFSGIVSIWAGCRFIKWKKARAA